MKKINIGNSELEASRIALGCMRMSNMPQKDLIHLIETAYNGGINFFDHADIYGSDTASSEQVFGEAFKNSSLTRDDVLLQSKCGIRNGYYDFSKEHIIHSVEQSLKRLGTDYLDVLALHRPDTLMDPEEVAQAFSILHESGKVRYFGVSNQNMMQMELLSNYVHEKLVVNQLQLSIPNSIIIDSGLNVNMMREASVNREGSILEYCRLKNITIQPWSPFQYGFFEGVFIGSDKYEALNKTMDVLAEKYGVTPTAIAIAWILRHPAKMQPIVGTTNANRLKQIVEADGVELTREEWYQLYRDAGHQLP